MIELIGLLAGLFEVTAVYLVGTRKNKYGFIVAMLCNTFWIAFSLLTASAWGLLIVCPLAFVMNARGYARWRKDERNQVDNSSET